MSLTNGDKFLVQRGSDLYNTDYENLRDSIVADAQGGLSGDYLSAKNDDTAEGAITFKQKTTHEAGADILGNVTVTAGGVTADGGFIGDLTGTADQALQADQASEASRATSLKVNDAGFSQSNNRPIACYGGNSSNNAGNYTSIAFPSSNHPTVKGNGTVNVQNLISATNITATNIANFSALAADAGGKIIEGDSVEIGTFTPTLVTGSFTYGNRAGIYKKIGKLVCCSMRLNWSSRSGNGNLAIRLPFTTTMRGNQSYSAAIGKMEGCDTVGRPPHGIAENSDYIQFFTNRPNNSEPVMRIENLSPDGRIDVSIVYETD